MKVVVNDTLFTSTVVAAVVAALVALWTVHRKISIENVTQDRKAWREKVRKTSLCVHDAIMSRKDDELNRLRAEFTCMLNPLDAEDNAIISCISSPIKGEELKRAEEFADRVALLLKHDWERGKLEAGAFLMRVVFFRDLINLFVYRPVREKYKPDS